jgi:tetratricopeptide (TPR) repeat protein
MAMRWIAPIKQLTKRESFSLVTGTVSLVADAIALTVFGASLWGLSPPPTNVAAVALGVLVLLVLWTSCLGAFFRVKRSALFDRRGRPIVTRSTRRVRRLALCGIIGLPCTTLLVLLGWVVHQSQPPEDIIILVTRIDGPEPQRYRVTENILVNLNSQLANEEGVRVEYLPRSVAEGEGSEVARALGTRPFGSRNDASVVIWGWYGTTATHAEASIAFEILRGLPCDPQVESGLATTCEIAGLDSFELQGELSEMMLYLSAFVAGMARYGLHDYSAAEASLTLALAHQAPSVNLPGRETTLFYRASARYHQGFYEQAAGDLTDAISIDPTVATFYYNRGLAYCHLTEYSLAVADLTQATALAPGYSNAYHTRGRAYAQLAQYREAIADFTSAIRLDHYDALSYYDRALAHAHLDEYEEAIWDYSQAIRLDPAFAFAYHNRGVAYYELGRYTEALDDYSRAIAIDDGDPLPYNGRGHAYRALGEYDQAISDYDEAILRDPGYHMAYYGRGLARYHLGQYPEAISDLESYLRLATSECEACRKQVQEYIDEMRGQR